MKQYLIFPILCLILISAGCQNDVGPAPGETSTSTSSVEDITTPALPAPTDASSETPLPTIPTLEVSASEEPTLVEPTPKPLMPTVTETSVDARVNLDCAIGKSYIDLNLTDIDNIDNASYKGFVSLIDFDLGKFANDEQLGKSSMDLKEKDLWPPR